PIKLIGTGEKLDAIEDFYPARIADLLLGMGDIVSLVEKAASTIDAEQAARVTAKMRKGTFDLSDLREQIAQMQHMGGMSGMMSMLPGIAKIKNQLAERNLDETVLKRQVAIIDSMTPQARHRRRLRHQAGRHQSAAENASHHGRRDEGHGRRQARPDGRPRQYARLRRRHAEPGRDGEARRKDAWRIATRHARRAGRPWPAAEFPR